MRNERPDLLEIIFEHRNKEYGAYALRRGYASTMTRSLLAGVGLVMTAAVLLSMKDSHATVGRTAVVMDSVPFIIQPPPTVDPPPPPPPARPQVHTIVNNVPVVVPNDQVPPDRKVPPVDSLVNPAFGDRNIAGADPVDNTSTTTAGPATTPVPDPLAKTVYESNEVEEPAEFPGGAAALGRFLQQRLQDPRDGNEDADGQVKVRVLFVVGADGEVGAFKPLGEAEPRFSEEVVRALRKMPRWKPARQKGRPVAMYFVLPVVFDHKTE